MNTSKNINEAMSTLADGEATDADIDAALAALETEEGRAHWAMIHQIGDALRSDDTAAPMRPTFLPELFARLDAEPVVLAPAAMARPSAVDAAPARRGLARRMAVPGLAAAAATAFALYGGSQLMVAQQAPTAHEPAVMLASAATAPATQPSAARRAAAGSAEQGELLRDPDIDQYLMAHQRFSPSLYSTAQYARSPVFANESGK